MYDVDSRRAVVEDFSRRWHRFVLGWNQARRKSPERAETLVAEALEQGLPPAGDDVAKVPSEKVELACARAVVTSTPLFDADGYLAHHYLVVRKDDPAVHFVRDGWRDLCAPSPRFDLWWYWAEYLDPTRESVNPLLHYLLVGRHEGLSPLPDPAPARTPTRFDEGSAPSRVCLFAGYDVDGLVDDYVVEYVRELSRHADVYYLADGVLEPGQLDRLAGHTKGAWAVPHAAYDFGSFSMLARELVGWEVLEQYDEVLLVNDSCYLVRPLDEVFAEMDGRACDWWSLQATSMEHDESYDGDDAPMPLAEAKRRFVGPERRWSDVHYLHLSSYFLAFRRPVIADAGFRWRLDTVVGQREKAMVIHKYEVGTSRYLMDAGFEFDTWIDDLYAFHPLYSRHVFELLGRGFPLVKRNFLAENPRFVLDLDRWPERIAEVVPDPPLEVMRANIERVSPADRNHSAYDVRLNPRTGRRVFPDRPLAGYGMRMMDKETPSFDHWWAFPLSAADGRMDAGLRAVFEEVRDDPSIKKVVLTRNRSARLEAENLTVLPLGSAAGQEALVRCGRVLVDAEPGVAVPLPLTKAQHDYVHVGIGLPVLPQRPASEDSTWHKVRGLAVSSHAEALVRAAGFAELDLSRMWLTGLPRHDFLVRPHDRLPADVRAEEERVRERIGERRVVVLWSSGEAEGWRDVDLHALAGWAHDHDVVLAVREPRVDSGESLTAQLADHGVLGLSSRHLVLSSVAHRVADVVVTDGADEAFDAAVTGVPILLVDHGPDDGADESAADRDRTVGRVVRARLAPESEPEHQRVRGPGTTDAVAGALERPRRPASLPSLDGASAWRLAQQVRLLGVRS